MLSAGIYLSLKGKNYQNNSVFSTSVIGNVSTGSSLECVTDRKPCCASDPNRAGQWLFPDGGLVPIQGLASTFYRSRGDAGTVNLNRLNSDITMPTGRFCCVVPDNNDVQTTICAIICKQQKLLLRCNTIAAK